MSFKTGTVKHGTPSDISSSIYSLLNKLQNVNNTDTKFSLDVDRFSNDLRNAHYVNTTVMNIFPKQRNFINRKAIFFFATQNKNETVALNAKDKIPRGLNSNELSHTDNIANNVSNVNNAICCFVYSE